ncbi:MAG: sensor domain-containing diguanylate cyclase [Arenimonas sp.]
MDMAGADGEISAVRQLAMLQRIARIVIQDVPLQPILQHIVDILHEEFGWEFVACVRVDMHKQNFIYQALRSSLESDLVVGSQRPLSAGAVGECARTARIISVDSAGNDPASAITADECGSEICVPSTNDRAVVAVFNARSRHTGAFDGQHMLLEAIADQIAGAIRLADLQHDLQGCKVDLRDSRAKLESLSRTDDLTGVANRRYFDLWLGQALSEAKQLNHSLALLKIDVDHFKPYNEGYGPPAGDACLQQVAALLSYCLEGTTARLARYGGEEFAVILAGADLEAAATIAERLRSAIEARALKHRYTPLGFVTISVGVAACRPEPSANADGLIALADTALYSAKRLGRNRVRVASA